MIKRQWIISALVTLLFLVLAAIVYQKFLAHKKSMVSESSATLEVLKVATKTFEPSEVQSKISIDGRVNACCFWFDDYHLHTFNINTFVDGNF